MSSTIYKEGTEEAYMTIEESITLDLHSLHYSKYGPFFCITSTEKGPPINDALSRPGEIP